ncbi:hypothetical protein AAE478_009131 [Parahypoxylon ruwenzoriense]
MQRYEGIWRKRYLLPSWILIVFAVSACLLLVTAAWVQRRRRSHRYDLTVYWYYGYSAKELVRYARITGGVVLGISIGTIVLSIAEGVLYAHRRLSPVLLLSLASVKTLIWGAYFVISVVSAVARSASMLDLALSLVLESTSVQLLVLGAVFTHRVHKGLLGRRKDKETTGVEGGYDTG